ncbi:MAG: AAA family ATPase [Bacillota bacterium]|nr:AAA family ATPase [Bacillota bacterium]
METAVVYNFKQDVQGITRDFLNKNSMSIEELAKKIGFSRPALTQYLSGKYASNPANIEKAIIEYLKVEGFINNQNEKALTTSPQKISFFPSRDAKNIIAICQSCQESQGLGIISGKSGFGKTHALKQYAKAERVCYIYCDDAMGCRDLIETIEETLGIPQKYGSISKRVKGIKKFFNVNKGYLLIIDEADKLLNKFTQKKMEILRTIYDPTDRDSDEPDVGLVIAGEPRLESLIKAYLPRFANRADFNIRLEGLSHKEVEKYLEPYNFTDNALSEMMARATNNQTGCFRLLNKTLRNILRLQPDTSEGITLDIISKASSMMML